MEISLPKTNLQNELLKAKKRNPSSKNYQFFNLKYDVSKLNSDNLFHLDQIRKICIDYRLRFLDVKLFKGKIPNEAFKKLDQFKNNHPNCFKFYFSFFIMFFYARACKI